MKTADFFTEWLDDEKLTLQRSTYEAYTVYINRHIAPYFSEHCPELTDITPRHIKDYINHLKTSGRLDGKPGGLSHASVRKHLSVIKQALNEAVVCGYIPSNPAQPVKLRRQTHSYSDNVVMLTSEDAQKLIDAFRGHELFPAVVLTLCYGLRRSEVLGLRWSSIDFDRNELRIEHTVVKNLTVEEKDTTKTDLSRATFQLFPNIRQMLLDMKSRTPDSSGYILTRGNGNPLRPACLTRSFQRRLKKMGLPKMRFHDLRHSTASILFDSGLPLEEVKDWLRHSDIETTSNIYLHYGKARRKLVSDTVGALFRI